MSHDRGCFKCYDDPPYDRCEYDNCPKLKRGWYSPAAVQARLAKLEKDMIAREIESRCKALNFWKEGGI